MQIRRELSRLRVVADEENMSASTVALLEALSESESDTLIEMCQLMVQHESGASVDSGDFRAAQQLLTQYVQELWPADADNWHAVSVQLLNKHTHLPHHLPTLIPRAPRNPHDIDGRISAHSDTALIIARIMALMASLLDHSTQDAKDALNQEAQ